MNRLRFERIDAKELQSYLDRGLIIGTVSLVDIETQVVSHGLAKITDQFFINIRRSYRILKIEEFKLDLDLRGF